MRVLREVPITDAEVREFLEGREKETELTYSQKNALSILRKFVRIEPEKARKIVEELKEIGMRDKQAVAIANFLPEDRDDLRTILQKEYNSFTDEEIEKILEIVKKNS